MATKKKQSKNEHQKLELNIKKALSDFTTEVKSKKLEKKINKYSSDLTGLILKLKEPTARPKAKKAKTKLKTAPAKQVKKAIADKKK